MIQKTKMKGIATGLTLTMMMTMCPAGAFAASDPIEGAEEMESTSIGGVTYYYADATGKPADQLYQLKVTTGRGPTAVTDYYPYTTGSMLQIDNTNYYYVVAPGAKELTGNLYWYTGGGTQTTYAEVYSNLGVDTTTGYDAVTSATNFTGFHAKDISSVVTFDTNETGKKAITGLKLGRSVDTVDAATYVKASILNAAGEELTEEQRNALKVTLKAEPAKAPAQNIVPVIKTASYESSRYGHQGEFDIVPDDTVEGYVWNEYWDNVYGATISDGEHTVGAVHWIDLYGEAATSGPHYNKIQIALNNGISKGSNEAEVDRYAVFCDEDGNLRAGKYTVTVYADGYTPLTATIPVAMMTETQITELNEWQIQGNAYVKADSTNQDLKDAIQEAAEMLKNADSTTDNDADILIQRLKNLIENETVSISETAWGDVTGETGTRTYQGLFSPTIFKEEYNDIWERDVEKLIGSVYAKTGAAILKEAVGGSYIGQEAIDANQKSFCCEMKPDEKLTFTVEDGKYRLSDGTNTYEYEYLGISYIGQGDDWAGMNPSYEGMDISFPADVYKATTEAGIYQYIFLCADYPEDTFHIEFRYGNNINDLQKALVGEYAMWLAAGIPSPLDDEMVENVIGLFVEENGDAVQSSLPSSLNLEAAVEKAEKLTESSYTSTTWKAMEAALEEAKAVLNTTPDMDESYNFTPSQDTINAATQKLNNAIAALKRASSGGGSYSGGGGSVYAGPSTTSQTDNAIVLKVGDKKADVYGSAKILDTTPIIVGDRTLVPIRFVAENLGCKVDWIADKQQVKITKADGTVLTMTIGQVPEDFDAAPIIMNNRTMVPIRYISEKMGYQVDWNSNTQTITITKTTK